MKIIKKILWFLSLILVYAVVKECISLYSYLHSIHPYLGYAGLAVFAFIFIYFVIIPIAKILRIRSYYGPVTDQAKIKDLIKKRIDNFKNNPYLIEQQFDFSDIQYTEESYKKIIKVLNKRADKLRDAHVSQVFYSTAVAQNGFLDALFILSGSINHVKALFILYNGRVSNRDLWVIAKNVYLSMAIGGSEGTEYATDEMFSKFASDSLKSIPFLDKIITSVADGMVNAILLTRISYITENYCSILYIRKNRDLYPTMKFVIDSAKHITSDILDRTFNTMKGMTILHKTADYAKIALNPIGYVWSRSIEKQDDLDEDRKRHKIEIARMVGNPLVYGVEKLFSSLKKG